MLIRPCGEPHSGEFSGVPGAISDAFLRRWLPPPATLTHILIIQQFAKVLDVTAGGIILDSNYRRELIKPTPGL